MIVKVIGRNKYGVVVERRGGGMLTASLFPGFRPSPNDFGWLEGNTLYPLPGKSSWTALHQSLQQKYSFLLFVPPGQSYTLEDGTTGVAGPDGVMISVPAGISINHGPPQPGQVTVPENASQIAFDANVTYYVYTRDDKIIFLEPNRNNLLGV